MKKNPNLKKTEQIVSVHEPLWGDFKQFFPLFSNIPYPLAICRVLFDKEGKPVDFVYVAANERNEELTSWKSQDMLGHRATEIYPEDSGSSNWISILGKVALTGEHIRIEQYFPRVSKWYSVFAFSPSKGYFAIISEDITERKKAEKALKKSEELYHSLFDNTDDGFILLEPLFDDKGTVHDFRFLKTNRAYEIQTGTRIAAAEAKTARAIAPELEQEWIAHIDKVVKTGKSMHYEDFNKRTGKWYDAHFFLFSEGQVGILFRDITDRKKIWFALEQSLGRYRDLLRKSDAQKEELETIFDSLPSQGWYKDRDDRIIKVNKAFANFMHMSKEELEGKPLSNFFPQEIVQKCWADDEEVIVTGKPKRGILDCYEAGNEVYWFFTQKVPYKDKNGKIIGTISFSTDITETKRLEKKLQEQERLAAIGQTAAMVGHDIRNPLHSMIGEIYLLKSNLAAMPDGKMKEEVEESLELLEDDISYVNKVVADLQDYSRPLKPEFIEADLYQLIFSVIQATNFPDTTKLVINGENYLIKTDITFLRRSLINLVTNAIQAMPNGGTLTVGLRRKADKVEITVKDTGVGIPSHLKPKLFSPMITTKAKGQGLGLAVVKRLIEALNGTINFESEEGKGAMFIIQLEQ